MGKKRRKKAQYEINPLTGRKERVPGAGEYRNPLTGRIEKAPKYEDPFGFGGSSNRSRSYPQRAPRRRKLTKKEQQAQAQAGLFAIIIMAIAFVIYWIGQNPVQATIIGVVLVGGFSLAVWKIPRFRQKILGRYSRVFEKKDDVDQELKALIREIKGMNVQLVRDEEDFEKQLYQRLEAKSYDVERQVAKQGRKIDLVVNRHVAIELKIADRSKNIQDLIGQVTIYNKYYDTILVGILDYGKVEDLDEYIEHIEAVSPGNIHVIVLDGEVRRRKTKKRYIKVEEQSWR